MLPPAVILVRPQLGENIGAVARAMHNFGLKDLRLVAPKNGWPNPRAVDMAAGAAHLLEAASLHDSVVEAMNGISLALATTARMRELEKVYLTPQQAAARLHAHAASGARTALLFGPERTGMTNEDVTLCDALITIPTAPENPSLNLSQAAVIMGYEWWQRAGLTPDAQRAEEPEVAPREELQGFFDQLEEYLDAVNHFRTPDKKEIMWQNLRGLFVRNRLNSQEVRTLRGVIRALYARRTVE